MDLRPGSERIFVASDTDPLDGYVQWAPQKSLWLAGMTAAGIALGPICCSWSAFALFLATSAVTLCAGHSVGMHRKLIHASFDCPLWLEHLFVYLGTLVGMAGPFGMIRLHDFRDWAQRQGACHEYSRHGAGFWRDAWWQLHCRLVLRHPPDFRLEPRLAGDRFYAFIERTWMLQQLPWALLFFAIGGLDWLVWGICVRVSVCVTGHWLVGHFSHTSGDQIWTVDGVAAQGYNVRLAALISMGENWHNNHHAYPGSAKLGLLPGQADPGWWLIRSLEAIGLVWNVRTPHNLPERPGLRRLTEAKLRDGVADAA
ncbi:acyl-CoA desaturase [Bradyrhizobium yuanmingense]|uniref:acyl-CoA desaturase n=1 Tax=Bradyrhizobium yuanmingense TaxID=108015 RepID=UPI0023BA3C09|nr:acyl-CoA desaturase [Bradyrhizobium yuanmingense]MDF0583510.1 acyl-CoA desaturase [Bradyrhizobium yuanmingense]